MQKIKYLFTLLLATASTLSQANEINWDELLANPARSAENRARDIYRHPRETLEFFEIAPGQKVLEIWPSQGWYSEILAPMLRDDGNYSVAHFSAESRLEFLKKARAGFEQKMAANKDVYGKVKIYTLELPVNDLPSAKFERIVTFRNVHNWMRMANAEPMFKAFYAALKPGGILGVVEHRAPESFSEEQQIKSGYVTEAYTKAIAQAAGFEFVGSSPVNNNPKDTKDYPKGVWTLPPMLALGEVDKAKYLAIGESDRFTLKFRKPEKN
jgi:predicted methyltransferase